MLNLLILSSSEKTSFPIYRFRLAIDFTKDYIKSSNDGYNVGQEEILTKLVRGCQVGESWGLNLASVGATGSVGHKVNAKLSLGRFHSGVGGARWDSETLGVQLEMVDKGFHGCLKG